MMFWFKSFFLWLVIWCNIVLISFWKGCVFGFLLVMLISELIIVWGVFLRKISFVVFICNKRFVWCVDFFNGFFRNLWMFFLVWLNWCNVLSIRCLINVWFCVLSLLNVLVCVLSVWLNVCCFLVMFFKIVRVVWCVMIFILIM